MHPVTGFLLAISRQAKMTDWPKVNTYCQWVRLQGLRGKNVWMRTVIDNGAMLNTLCASVWEKQRDWLTPLGPSDVILSVADNHRIPSKGTWMGVVDVAGAKVTQSFEVFDSNRAFEIILGKLWLKSMRATHHYMTDEITIATDDRVATLTNKPTSRPEVQRDAGPERTVAQMKVSMPETTAGRDARTAAVEGMAAAKGTVEC